MKVLIIQQKMIGDVLTSSILCEAIKDQYPNTIVHYLINSHTFSVVENNPFIDKFIFYTPEMEQNKFKFWQLLKSIKKEKYDAVVDVYSKLSSNLMTLLSGATLKISKYKSYTSFLYNSTFADIKTPKNNIGLAIENRMQLLQPLDISKEKNYKPKIYLTETEKQDIVAFLKYNDINLKKPIFMINVLGSSPSKTYPFEYMATIIEAIAEETKGQILFNYIPNQKADARAIYNLCSKKAKEHIYFYVFGKSLREFLAITSYCTAVIGNEGGAINMAKALNIPTFSIFSPWIDKKDWNLFGDNVKNESVHLKDLKPNIYNNKPLKEFKDETLSLYNLFSPEMIISKLKTYLSQF